MAITIDGTDGVTSTDTTNNLIVNRESTDGAIITTQKDGVTTGTISTYIGYMTIGPASGDCGLLIHNGVGSESIRPWRLSDNTGLDDVMDLGAPTRRFKNLYATNAVTGTNGSKTTNTADLDTVYGSGFYNISNTATGENPFSSGNSWAWVIHHEHHNENGYGFQMAVSNDAVPNVRIRPQLGDSWSNDWRSLGTAAWVNFNGTGTISTRASQNMSSIVDNGTGNYTINFTYAMPSTNYIMAGTVTSYSTSNFTNGTVCYYGAYNTGTVDKTTTSCRIVTAHVNTSAALDYAEINVQFQS